MDNVVIWIRSNRDVVEAYRKTKADCNYHHKSDNDFLMFLLEAATNVLSIVHQFSPQIKPGESPTAPSDSLLNKEDEINLEKLDKQLRINIVCPDIAASKERGRSDGDTPVPDRDPNYNSLPDPNYTPLPDRDPNYVQDRDPCSALQDISDHVNELETVLESLNKSCPSPGAKSFRPLACRSFLDSLSKPALSSPHSVSPHSVSHPSSHSESSMLAPPPAEPAPFCKSEGGFLKESSFSKFKPGGALLSKRLAVRVSQGPGSSPNVTISAESLLNMKQNRDSKDRATTILKPIPMMLKSPDKERTPSPQGDPQIDVVNPDSENRNPSSPSLPSPDLSQGLKRKAECMEGRSPCKTLERTTQERKTLERATQDCATQERATQERATQDGEMRESSISPGELGELPGPEQEQVQAQIASIPTETELTRQLMSAIQSTIAQSGLAGCPCSECALVFPSETLLHKHLLAAHPHSETELLHCPTCAFKTPRRQTLAKHITTVHARDRASGVLHCDQCEYKTPTKSHLRNHMLAHSGNRQYQCPHCTYNSNFSNALTRHMTMHSREMFESKMKFESHVNSGKSS